MHEATLLRLHKIYVMDFEICTYFGNDLVRQFLYMTKDIGKVSLARKCLFRKWKFPNVICNLPFNDVCENVGVSVEVELLTSLLHTFAKGSNMNQSARSYIYHTKIGGIHSKFLL